MPKRIALAALLVALPALALEGKPAQEVDGLLDFVGKSGCIFVRNGDSYPAAEARDHLKMKLGKAGDHIKTAEDFIGQIASRSYLSGQAYTVRCPGKPEQPTQSWLETELKRLRAQKS